MDHFVASVALVGIVIVVASLLSGVVERFGVPLVAAFLLLGASLGPFGLGLIDVQLGSPALYVLATLGLALVLFSDAVSVDTREAWRRRGLAMIVLGPGTLLPALLIALSAFWILDLPATHAAVLGGALASTDPVLLRSVMRAPFLPSTTRVALRLESGMNDAVLLPVVVLAILAAREPAGLGGENVGRSIVGLFLLGPVLGAIVGWIGITMLSSIRSRFGVRRDYESLYALGLGFGAYAAAEAVGGSGFLAAFAAGLAIAALDVELCDCFLEYGEATAEMLLLLTFVAFGTSLIWSGLTLVDGRTLAFAVIALAARTVVVYPVLALTRVPPRDRKLIAAFGPRGLSSLLLALLPVFAGVPGSDGVFTLTCLVVLLSIAIHGSVIGVFLRAGSRLDRPPSPGRAESPSPEVGAPQAERITIAEMRDLSERGEPVVVVDVRARKSYEADPRQAAGSIRVSPDDPLRFASEARLSQHATLVLYCA